jgi:pimeloyl-ACP methyl ester carboxylesterase
LIKQRKCLAGRFQWVIILKQKLTCPNGLQLAYLDLGEKNGYPLLAQHGLIASIDDYDLFERLLRRPIRLICLARPGYGESSPYLLGSYAEWAGIVSRLVDELQLKQFDILGMSSGAPYGYSIGYKIPEKVGNIFILSGIPALYDEQVLSEWPYKPIHDMRMSSLEELAHQLFFSNLTEEDLKRNDIRDSLMNHGFGVAQDLRLRFLHWGFRLSDVKAKVFMQHSKNDDSVPFQTAVRTAELLPNCHLELLESAPHFSEEVLENFIEETMVPNMPTL